MPPRPTVAVDAEPPEESVPTVEPDRVEPDGIETGGAEAATEPTTEADEGADDLEVWPFLNVTAATPATVTPDGVELDLTMAERTEDRTAALGSTVAVPPPPLPPAPTPAAAAEPFGDETAYVSTRPKRPRRSWRRWALIALVLALLVSVGVSAGALVADLTATPTHDVPAVKGLDVDAAREKLAANKWKIVEQRTRKDDTDPGEVLSVTPGAGTSLREGEQVTLLVSDGPTMADVPTDLAGQPVADATRALEARGFEVSTTEQYHEDVDADRVISLAEGTKMRQPKGETVGLIVSKGPEPRTIPDDLAGQTKADAIAELKALKLTPKTKGQYDENIEKDIVIGSAPGAGATVERGGEVVLVVSLGPPLVKVPDISGADSLEEAIDILRAGGLRPGEVSGPAEGHPSRTRPGAGTEVPKGSTVDLILRGKGGR
jgi:serine/threonine-protein kinase